MNAGEQISLFDQGFLFGKTSQAAQQPMAAKTSEQYCKKSRNSPTVVPLFLDLRKGTFGLTLEPLWQTDGLSLGAYTTRSFGDSPNVAAVCRLSQILEDKPHPKYCLSAKACQGILNRSERRGKALPPILEEALKQSVFKNVQGATGGVKAFSFKTNESAQSQPLTTNQCLTAEPDNETVAFSQDAYDKYTETESSATIKQSGGVYGGGSESLVIQ